MTTITNRNRASRRRRPVVRSPRPTSVVPTSRYSAQFEGLIMLRRR